MTAFSITVTQKINVKQKKILTWYFQFNQEWEKTKA